MASRDDERKDPHDRLVRDTLSIPANVIPVLSAALPAEVLARIDLGSLRLEPGSFVDRASEARTDLLFSAAMGEARALIYVLLEHQSRPDPQMPRRVLVYMERIWRAHRRAHGGGLLPVIVPVVLHHGAGGWTAPRRLGELLDWNAPSRAALAPHVPDFALIIDDLARVPEASLLEREGGPLGKLVVWVLRATRLGFDPALVARWAEELNRAEETGPREALLHLLQYLLGTEEGTAVFEALQSAPISAPVREVVMGYLQKWFEEGRAEGEAKGRAEGEAKGRAEALIKQLRLRFDDVPPEVERRVREASIAELDRWVERVLSAETLDGVLD